MRTKKTLVLALLALVSLFVVACGGDDKTATPAPTGTPSPTATSEPSQTATSTGTATETSTATETATQTETATETAVTGPAELDLGDGTATSDGSTLVIPSATLAVDGFVAIHANDNGAPGAVIGVSGFLAAGTATDIEITLDEPLTESGTVFPMVHVDGDANGQYEFPGPDGPATTASGEVAVAPLDVTVEGGEPTETATETATEEPSGTPTEEPTSIETQEPDADAEAFAHAALLEATDIGEGWTVTDNDQFSDSFSEGIDSDSAACQELNSKLQEANALSVPARIGRAQRSFSGPTDPNNRFGGNQMDVEINVFDNEDAPSQVIELYGDALGGDLFQQCFEETILAQAPAGTDAKIEKLTPSTEAPHGGAAIAFSLSFGAAGVNLTLVVEAYVWAQDDLGVTVSFTGSEADPELISKAVDAVHDKIDNTPR